MNATETIATPQPATKTNRSPHLSTEHFLVLADLFCHYHGFVPEWEFTVNRFKVAELVANGFILPPQSHLESGYTIGEALLRAPISSRSTKS